MHLLATAILETDRRSPAGVNGTLPAAMSGLSEAERMMKQRKRAGPSRHRYGGCRRFPLQS